MLSFVQVSGRSMMPSFKPRQYVLSVKSKNIKKNDVIVFRDNLDKKFIKRVSWIDRGKFQVESDNSDYPSMITSKILKTKNIIGKVVFKF